MTLLKTLQDRIARRGAYLRTRREIEALSLDVALDLGIFREDADKIARNAVYGA